MGRRIGVAVVYEVLAVNRFAIMFFLTIGNPATPSLSHHYPDDWSLFRTDAIASSIVLAAHPKH